MDEPSRDTADVQLYCRLCCENVGRIEDRDPHLNKARRYLLGAELHSAWGRHQMTDQHRAKRVAAGLRD